MSTPSVPDGNYKLTAAKMLVYYSNGTLFGSFTYLITHDSSVTPGYLAYVLEWKGSGVYRITYKGKATLTTTGVDDTIIDCTSNGIAEGTLDTDGNLISETSIQTGCGGSSSSLSEVSQKFTVISGGFQHYAVFKDSDSNQYQITYSFQKQTSTDNTTWTKQLGTSSGDYGQGVTTDSSGNIYVTGTTNGDLDGNTSSGGVDIFLIKYNSSGTKQWTKQLGTSSDDGGYGVTTDSSGKIYVTGYTGGGLHGITSSGSQDIFLVKYNSSGTRQWTKQLGTSSDDRGQGVKSDSSGNIYVTGYTGGGLHGITSSGSQDIFLVKYNSSGTRQWIKQLGTSADDAGLSVAIDSSNNIYVTGYTKGGLDNNTSSGGGSTPSDIFLVKYNSRGVKQWTQQLGTSSVDTGNGVTVDSNNNIYVTGYTRGGLDGNTSAGSYDIFLVKYNSSGTKQWTRQLGTSSSGGDWGKRVSVDNSSNIYVTGTTYGGLDNNTVSGDGDIFLVKYNSSGTKQWTRQLGDSTRDEGNGVTVDSIGNIYVTGYTGGGLDGNTSSGGADIFLLKYNSDGVLQ